MNNTPNSGDLMGINLTRKQWLAARERFGQMRQRTNRTIDVSNDDVVEAILGPCPLEDAPEPSEWYKDRLIGRSLLVTRLINNNGVWVGFGVPNADLAYLTAAEALQMAKALVEHATYAREMEEQP